MTLSDISYGIRVKNRIVQVEIPGDGVWDGEEDIYDGDNRDRGTHGGGRLPGIGSGGKTSGNSAKDAASEERQADVRYHRFWKRGTTTIFEVQIFNLDAGSYLCMTPEKALAKAEKEKKYNYFQNCLECRRHFTSLVFYADRNPGVEAQASTQQMESHLIFKLKR